MIFTGGFFQRTLHRDFCNAYAREREAHADALVDGEPTPIS
jgi:hypothetical protein